MPTRKRPKKPAPAPIPAPMPTPDPPPPPPYSADPEIEPEAAFVPKVRAHSRGRFAPHVEIFEPKDPNLHIRLVRDVKKRINKHKRDGYEVATERMLAEDHTGQVDEQDGVVRFGDRIAMVTSREHVDARRRERLGQDEIEETASEREVSGPEFYQDSDHGKKKGNRFYSFPK
jgi:hypothetical protein